MQIHVLVEGPSEAEWIPTWAKRLAPRHYARVYPFQGKQDLLKKLDSRLSVFGSDYARSDRVLVLVDRDNDRCPTLGNSLRDRHERVDPRPLAKFRVAVVETEAFFLGDTRAIRAAWPSANLAPLTNTRPDLDWTKELFMEVIGVRTKNERAWARAIAPHLGTRTAGRGANRSPSFRAFATAFLALCA